MYIWLKFFLHLHNSHKNTTVFKDEFKLNWLYPIAQLMQPTTLIPYPPPRVIFFPCKSMAESTGAPFAVTYGEQGRHCERVALSGAVT